MTFAELRDLDNKYYAFSSFITVKDAKAADIIPKDYWEFFPDYCKCGSENIITADLQQPQCCNPKCYIKQGYALSELLTRFKCKGLGPARCIEIIQELSPKFQYNSYIEILNYTYDDLPVSLAQRAYSLDLINAVNSIRSEKITFPALMSNLAIPTLGDKALKLFQGINSFAELLEILKQCGGLFNFCSDRGVRDSMVLFWIRQSAVDMWLADTIMRNSIRQEGVIKLEICITGFLYLNGSRITKDAFVKLCNDMSTTDDGVQVFEVVQNTAKVSAKHIIADSPSRSAKYLAGLQRGEEIDIDGVKRSVLMSSSEFIDYLKELKEKWEQKQQKTRTNSQSENLKEMKLF